MKRKRKRCWGLAIAASAVMVLSALPAFAAPAEDSQVYTISEDFSDVTPEMSDVDAAVAGVSETEEVDTSDPELAAVAAELDDIEVTAEDGTTTALTDEQKTTVLNLFSQYQQNWKDNADTLGVQMPFYLQYNDSEEDGLGVLGEMLVLAGYTVDDVRNGKYSYDDLTGMIMNFYYGDKLGVEYYGSDIKSDRDEALQAVEESGAQTDYQKLLVLNDYLASTDSFDMSYIMNSGKDTPVMVAENEQKHEHYDDVYNVLYEAYKPQIEENFRSQIKEEVTTQFHDQIFAGIETSLRQQYYESAIKNIVYQQALASAADPENPTDEEKAAAEETAETYMTENADAISEDAAGFVETNFGSDAATQLSTGADEFIASAETDGVEVSDGVTMTVEELTQQQLADDETLNVDMDGDGTNDTTFPDAIDAYTEAAMTSTDPALDLDGDGTDETSIPDAIKTYTTQAATQLTTGVLNYWEGSHIGAFGEGKSVCLGYAKAFAYLVQCMNSEYYCGGADYKTASNWKTASELYYDSDGNLSIDTGYMVDLVRISFAADVTMYGETQEDFNSDHFWNAVKVNGTWYYIDPCYTDVYTEVMIRDRVETAGYINHMYFMFSHTTTTSLYDGYYSEIKSLYSEAATDQTYENVWFARAKSNVYSDGDAFYYIYDSTDTIGMMDEYNSSGLSTGTSTASDVDSNQASSSTSSMFSSLSEAARYKLVKHTITEDDSGSSVTTNDDTEVGDADYTTLIEFNYSEDDDDKVGVARVLNAAGEMEENELLTKLYAQHAEQAEIYPSIAITCVLYNSKLYFNLSNTILSYDPSTGTVAVEKQYGTVYGTRDKTNAFGGMAFSLSEDSGDIELSNHPIAGLYLDGSMLTVSIATNLSYISGKEGDNGENRSTETDYTADSATNGYGYVYEETNYNPSYNSYTTNNSMYSQYGVEEEINDNDEFMWVSNFVGTTDISGLSAPEYDSADDLLINCDHHYIKFDETYFTKDDDGNWNTGFCYVCTQCGKAVEEPTDNSENSYLSDEEKEEAKKEYEEELAEYNAAAESAGHTYSPVDDDTTVWSDEEDGTKTVTFKNLKVSCICPDVKELLDCLYYASWDETVTLDEAITATAKKSESGDCYKDGITYTWTAEGKTAEEDGVNYLATMSESGGDAGTQHVYTGEFTWTETDGGYSAAVSTLKCSVCGATAEDGDCTVTYEAVDETCTAAGGTKYTATYNVYQTDEDGNATETVIGFATEEKMVEDTENHAALRHDLTGVFTWTEEKDENGTLTGYTVVADVTCSRGDLTRENVEAEVTYASDDATCTEAGTVTYTAAVTVYEQDENGNDTETEAGTVTDTKEVTGVALGHDYEGEWTWSGKDAVLTMTCSRCGDVQTPNVTVEKTASTDPTCTEEGSETYQATATFDYDGETYSDEKEIAIDALGHDYAEEEWGSWASDASSVSFALGCSRCDSVVNPEVTINGEGTATCTEAGTRTFTATAKYGDKIYTHPETKSLTVAALGHTDADEYGECTRCHEILMLDAPALTGVSDVNGGVKVKWSAVSGAAQYRVYVKKDGKWTKAGDTTGKSFTYTSVKSGTKYEFTVACLSKNGKNVVSSYDTTGKSVVYLTAGKVTSVTNASGGVTVKWKKVTGASGYYIYRKTGSGSYSKIATIKSGSTVKYTDKKVKSKNGKTYTYAVKAYSGKSVGAKVTTKKIVRLTGVSLKSLTNVKGKKLTVKWKKNSKATGYQIAYSTSSSFASSKTKTVKVSKAKTVSKKLSKLSKKKYYVRIRVYRKVSGTTYYSAWSSKKSVKIKK